MRKIIKSLVRVAFWVGGLIGLAYVPADIAGLPETYPVLRVVTDMERETLLFWFSSGLVIYLIYVEIRPYLREWRRRQSWVSYPEAAQIIYEEYKSNDMVLGLMSDTRHPRPVEDVMGSWIEDGIRREIIHPFGRREHSNEIEKIPANISIETGIVFEKPDGKFDDEIAAFQPEGRIYWRNLRFKRKDILSYLQDLERDTLKGQSRKALKKKSG